MQTEYIQFFKGEVHIGDYDMSKNGRQIVMPVVDISRVQAPKKVDGNHYMDVRLYFSDESTKWAGQKNCAWLVPGPGSVIEDIQVLVAFKAGTFDPALFDPMPEELSQKVDEMNAEADPAT